MATVKWNEQRHKNVIFIIENNDNFLVKELEYYS